MRLSYRRDTLARPQQAIQMKLLFVVVAIPNAGA